jgi:hypothetical protein
MLSTMKCARLCSQIVLFAACWLPIVCAQDQPAHDAAVIAARQELDERFRRLESAVESIQAAQLNFQRRLGSIADDLDRLREEIARKPNETVSREELRSLEKKVVELNEKRESDKRLILEQLEKLSHTVPVIPSTAPSKPVATAPNPDQPGFEYEVQPRDALSTIVSDFNAEFKKRGLKGTLTVEQVMKANNIKKATSLRVGQKLFIPEPTRP